MKEPMKKADNRLLIQIIVCKFAKMYLNSNLSQ